MRYGVKSLSVLALVSLIQFDANAEVKTREIGIGKKLLLVPVGKKTGGRRSRGTQLTIKVGGTLVHKLNAFLAPSEADIIWWGYLDMSEYVGRTAHLSANVQPESKGLEMIENSGTIRNPEPLYREALRPRYHFMQKQGWNNDPNGLVYYDGEYHYFWQCNPLGKKWANMYWGHAVSKDLLHWEELPRAMRPFGGGEKNRHRSMAVRNCFSGSANVDFNNSLGVQKGRTKTLVAAYTDTGCGEVLAYSTDRGRTWTYHREINPVIKHRGRDPKLVWYAPGRHWVIAVYTQIDGRAIGFYSSTDMKTWTKTSQIKGYYECPELFELPVDGDKTNTRWVIFGGNALYTIGRFDGKTFTPEHKGTYKVLSGRIYAGQCYSNPPDGRVIYLGWARGVEIPLPAAFNQGITVPLRFTLRTTKGGIRMFAEPIKELDTLHEKTLADLSGNQLRNGHTLQTQEQELDIKLTLRKTGDGGSCSISVGSYRLDYNTQSQKLRGMPAPMNEDGTVDVRILVDRTTVEVCGGGGAIFHLDSRGREMGKPVGRIEVKPGNGVAVQELQVFKMKSTLPE